MKIEGVKDAYNLGVYFKEVVFNINNELSSRFEVEFELRYHKGTWIIYPTVAHDFILPDWVTKPQEGGLK